MNPLATFTKQPLPMFVMRAAALMTLALLETAPAQSIDSRTLTDKISSGDGIIDLMKDIGGADLATYFKQTGGLLLLGADVNEEASGNESSGSLGIAIKEARLSIRTTEGDFTFKNFLTSTSAKMREAGSSEEREYATLFGQGGGSGITGSGKLDISRFDDVLWFENIEFEGRITSASLSITFLPTPDTKPTENESFFDFSGGLEDIALFNVADAVFVEKANIGQINTPPGVKFESKTSALDAIQSALGNEHSGDGHGNGGTSATAPALEKAQARQQRKCPIPRSSNHRVRQETGAPSNHFSIAPSLCSNNAVSWSAPPLAGTSPVVRRSLTGIGSPAVTLAVRAVG